MSSILVPVPKAMVELIHANNELLKKYQQELSSRVLSANEEMMRMLNLNPADGWRLDTDTMSYVKIEADDTSVSE